MEGKKRATCMSQRWTIIRPKVGINGSTSFWPVNATLAGDDVGPTLTHHWNQCLDQRHIIWSASNVGSMCIAWANIGPPFTFATGGPTLRPPANMTLDQQLLPTLRHQECCIWEAPRSLCTNPI